MGDRPGFVQFCYRFPLLRDFDLFVKTEYVVLFVMVGFSLLGSGTKSGLVISDSQRIINVFEWVVAVRHVVV